MSPLDPRVEVRFVPDPELDAILREIVEPGAGIVQSTELRRAIRDELGLWVDDVRVRLSMERVLASCSDLVPARRTGLAFGTLRHGLSAHQRLRIRAAA